VQSWYHYYEAVKECLNTMQTEIKNLNSNNLTAAEIYEHKFIHNLSWSKYDDYIKDCK
jgi:hypothetical protein